MDDTTKKTNLAIYNDVREVPETAQKPFDNGTFKGTDIKPMWRIKTLTEQFGPAGFGWYYEVLSERSEQYLGTTMAIVDINLYVKIDGEWSKPIFGTGGNALVKDTKSGQKVSDEGYKMALTDALSVACKALGIGADVYWKEDATKYTQYTEKRAQAAQNAQKAPEAGKDTPKAQTAQETHTASQNERTPQERPSVMDDIYYHRILTELLAGTGVTMGQLDAICMRDMGGKHIEELDEQERKKFYVDTKTGTQKIKGGNK